MWFALITAWATELPLPEVRPRSPWPAVEWSVGSALLQAPAVGHAYPKVGLRYNLNSTLLAQIGASRWYAGGHIAYQNIPYGPRAGNRRTQSLRIEPRVGLLLGSGPRVRTHAALGLAVESLDRYRLGPVLSVGPRVRLGESGRNFFFGEARLAPRFEAWGTQVLCSQWCDQARVLNPGGTGLLFGFGSFLGR